MIDKTILTEAAKACGDASATLARFRSLLAGAGSLNSPCIKPILSDLRRVAVEIECTAIALAQATQGATE
ncbi:hypothetical protein [Ralstonia pseudosolanacearum]|uniref:hypothetical protein n=1 Tax=Ralstonia pseudosolanacearum TaxID=1310165 RepID=UPI003AAC85D4